jgi:hypothetical protein
MYAKKHLTKCVCLRLLMLFATYPDHNKWLDIHTDASDFQLGACIIQEGRLVVYYSCKLMKSQQNYTVHGNGKRNPFYCCYSKRILRYASQCGPSHFYIP